MLLDTRNKNTYGLGVGISMVFDIFRHFLYQRMEPPRNVMTYYIPSDMFLKTKNKNKYGLGVGISTVFEIFGHFLLGSWDHPVWS
jgi:hypothetical protein